jgi:ElaB/YqjD/DUF883 family membrane-anchored ribosome-binding protein
VNCYSIPEWRALQLPNNTPNTPYGSRLSEEASHVGDKFNDAVSHAKDKVSDLGTTAANKIDEKREAAADGLKRASTAMHDNAGQISGGDKLTGLAHSAADALGSTADYIRGHDTSKMMADVMTVVKSNPGPSILAAIVIGFLAGRAFSSNNS